MNPSRTEDTKPWPLWLKTICGVVLAVAGFGVGWSTWVTNGIFASQHTASIVVEHSDTLKSHEKRFSELPPEDWRERIRALERATQANQDAHTQILLNLEQIKTKLGVLPDHGTASN